MYAQHAGSLDHEPVPTEHNDPLMSISIQSSCIEMLIEGDQLVLQGPCAFLALLMVIIYLFDAVCNC